MHFFCFFVFFNEGFNTNYKMQTKLQLYNFTLAQTHNEHMICSYRIFQVDKLHMTFYMFSLIWHSSSSCFLICCLMLHVELLSWGFVLYFDSHLGGSITSLINNTTTVLLISDVLSSVGSKNTSVAHDMMLDLTCLPSLRFQSESP